MFIIPEITKGMAVKIFSQPTSFFPLTLLKRPLQFKKIELIYLPFYVFTIFLSKNQKVTIAIDGLLGHSLFFTKEKMNFQKITNHPHGDFVLPPSEAQKIALNEYKGVLLEQSLRSRKNLNVENISEAQKIFYPFWIGYFLKRKAYDFKALDALSGQLQGIKMRKVFLKGFRQIG